MRHRRDREGLSPRFGLGRHGQTDEYGFTERLGEASGHDHELEGHLRKGCQLPAPKAAPIAPRLADRRTKEMAGIRPAVAVRSLFGRPLRTDSVQGNHRVTISPRARRRRARIPHIPATLNCGKRDSRR